MSINPCRRRPRYPRPSEYRRSARSVLAELAGDVGYLEVKEQLGELAPTERARLDAIRAAAAPQPIGGPP
jgi:hypothetical protein